MDFCGRLYRSRIAQERESVLPEELYLLPYIFTYAHKQMNQSFVLYRIATTYDILHYLLPL